MNCMSAVLYIKFYEAGQLITSTFGCMPLVSGMDICSSYVQQCDSYNLSEIKSLVLLTLTCIIQTSLWFIIIFSEGLMCILLHLIVLSYNSVATV